MNSFPWSYQFYRLTWIGVDWLFPPTCAGCGKAGWRWYPDCQGRVPRIAEPFCEKCGIPVRKTGLCEKCQAEPPAYRTLRSWAVFDSPIQNALHRMKYRRDMGLGHALAMQMIEIVKSLNWNFDLIVPIPLGKARFRERGYNQVALVAHLLAYDMGVEYLPHRWQKVRDTRSLVGLNISQRRENVQNVYQADPSKVKRKTILLMGNVATTGLTLSSATDALLSAGATEVYAITLARALSHHSLDRV